MLHSGTQSEIINKNMLRKGKNMDKNIHVRVNSEFKNKVIDAAKQQNLTLTAFVIAALNDRINSIKGEKND